MMMKILISQGSSSRRILADRLLQCNRIDSNRYVASWTQRRPVLGVAMDYCNNNHHDDKQHKRKHHILYHQQQLHKQQHQHTQIRSFHLWDIIRSGSLTPSNPLLDAIQDDDSVETKKSPDFHRFKPHHLIAAAKEVQNQCLQSLVSFETNEIKETDFTATQLLQRIDMLETPSRNILNVASVFAKIHTSVNTPWRKAIRETAKILTFPHLRSKPILGALQVVYATRGEADGCSKELQRMIGIYEANGAHLDSDRIQTLTETDNAIQRVSSKLIVHHNNNHDPDAPVPSTRETLQHIYTVLGLKQREANLHGFPTPVDRHFQKNSSLSTQRCHFYSKDQITALHHQVARRAKIVVENHIPPAAQAHDVMTKRRNSNNKVNNEKELIQYLTLDGALSGMFAISSALFRIVVREENDHKKKAWDNEVRLFHFYDGSTDQETPLGSLYLDPFRRPLKSSEIFMGQLIEAPTTKTMTTFMNLNIRPPIWDDIPNQISLKDAVDLFHEWGHVLQFILADREKGSINGAFHLSLDVSEILPQFMEHWLFEEPILQTLAHLSYDGQRIPDEIIKLVQEDRSTQKAYETLQRAFLGELELSLFSKEEGTEAAEESVVATQRRIAEEFVPYDIPAKGDLSPTLDVITANIGAKPIAQYRYLLSEIISSNIFCAFREAGIDNQDAMKRMGGELKRLLLIPGASIDVKTAVEELLRKGVKDDTDDISSNKTTPLLLSPESYFKLYQL